MGAHPSHSAASESTLALPTDEPSSPFDAYDAYFDLVYRNVRRGGVAESQAEDAVQDVFLIVHRRWTEFQHRSTLRTWILGITLRVASEYRRKRLRAASSDDEAVAKLESNDSPEELAASRQARALLLQLLDHLSEEHRSILVLVELEELPVAEAAAAIGVPVSTAYKRLRKANEAFEQAHRRYRASTEWRESW